MVSRVRLLRACLAFLTISGAVGGCDDSAPLIARDPEPLLYLVLARTPWTGVRVPDGRPPDGSLAALVLTAGIPARPEYRPVDAFEMRRASDGARFDWNVVPRTGFATEFGGNISLGVVANVLLAPTGRGDLLGRADIGAGEYLLRVTTGGVVVEGRTRMPDDPVPRIIIEHGRRVAVWPPTPGAAAYELRADTDGLPAFTTDTVYVLRDDASPPSPKFRLAAMDENYARYRRGLLDPTMIRAGIDRGVGIFGAYSSAVIDIPPR